MTTFSVAHAHLNFSAHQFLSKEGTLPVYPEHNQYRFETGQLEDVFRCYFRVVI